MNKSIVAIYVDDTRYGEKLFDYLNEKYANANDYIYYDSLSELKANIANLSSIVTDETLVDDLVNSIDECTKANVRIVILAESLDGISGRTINNYRESNITFIYRYQQASNICMEIVKR